MNKFKKTVDVKNEAGRSRLWLVVLIGILLLSPVINTYQTVQAEIDETIPASIPSQITADWEDRDGITGSDYASATTLIIGKLSDEYVTLFNAAKMSVTGDKNLYYLACHYRRVEKLKPFSADLKSILFAKHHNFGGFIVGYHDNADAAYSDDEWTAKSALCILDMKNYYSTFTKLLEKTDAVVRDPCISLDGKKVLFAMSGTTRGTGFKIYEAEIANPSNIKQLTTDPGVGTVVSDFEPCYLPNGDIAFSSTRCFGLVPEAWHPTTNMFIMDGKGKYLRRVGYDQVHTFYPVLRDDGVILYTRWEYNDRVRTNCMGLFSMNPDGCRQTEVFGNQTSWPYTKIHARPIPNSEKVIAVAGGQHGPYSGELMIIDPTLGADGSTSIQMIAPKRACKATVSKSDRAAGDVQFLFQNPLPLDENSFLVSWRKTEDEKIYNLYFMDIDGKRELLAWDNQSLSQPVLIKSRRIPPALATNADYSQTTAVFTMQNVYVGEGLKKKDGTTVAKGTAKKLRVIGLNYRVQGGSDGYSTLSGNKDSGFVSAPISKFGASWESKTVLGETPIFEDGSAAFIVPARKPLYFQVLDSLGYCIATMRSWSTLMPGEQFPCIGCHESKIESPTPGSKAIAEEATPLETPLGIENQYFDYYKMIQPIWDRNCISCHKTNHESGIDLRGDLLSPTDAGSGYSDSRRSWTTSYVSLMNGIGNAPSNNAINICTIFSPPEQQPAYSFGSSQSPLMTKIINGNHHDVKLTQTEKNIVACWIDLCAPHAGYYNNYMSAPDSTYYAKLLDTRLKWETLEAKNIEDYINEVKTIPNRIDSHKRAQYPSVKSAKQLRMNYLSNKRVVVLDKPVNGELFLLDLRGRVIATIKYLKPPKTSAMSIPLPATVGSGLYIARFKGDNLIQQILISITK